MRTAIAKNGSSDGRLTIANTSYFAASLREIEGRRPSASMTGYRQICNLISNQELASGRSLHCHYHLHSILVQDIGKHVDTQQPYHECTVPGETHLFLKMSLVYVQQMQLRGRKICKLLNTSQDMKEQHGNHALCQQKQRNFSGMWKTPCENDGSGSVTYKPGLQLCLIIHDININ